jgi:hypothetical protein
MTKLGRTFDLALLVALCFLIFARDAHAYIDPGTTNFLLQMLIAGIVAAAFALKTFWRNAKEFTANLFSRKPREEKPKRNVA